MTLIIVAVVTASSYTSAYAQKAQFVYSVKFLCGIQPTASAITPTGTVLEPPVKPGNYATAINVHNYHQRLDVSFCKKAVAALPEEVLPRATPGNFVNLVLSPDQALEVDCTDIIKLLPPSLPGTSQPSFIKGFVEIRSPTQLNVVAVYTSQGCHAPGTVSSCQDSLGELALEVVPQPVFSDVGACPQGPPPVPPTSN